jgi:hypothetical protein
MNVRNAVIGACFTLAIALVSCGNTGGGGTPCNAPTGAGVQNVYLIYPVPGSTSVPAGIGLLVYASNVQQTISLFSGTLPPIVASPAALPSPVPSPNVTAPAGTNLYAVSVPALANAAVYNVDYALNPPPVCGQTTAQFSYFTTQ